jgi:hypothetical protein
MFAASLRPISYVIRNAGWVELFAIVISGFMITINAGTLFSLSHFVAFGASLFGISTAYAAVLIFIRQTTDKRFRFVQLIIPCLILSLTSSIPAMVSRALDWPSESLESLGAFALFFVPSNWLGLLFMLGFFPFCYRTLRGPN